MAIIQTTFRYFNKNSNHTEQEDVGCTILPQAYHLPLIFDNNGIVDFKEPQCIHCGSKLVKRNGSVRKYIIHPDKYDREHVFICNNYTCKNCRKNSSPILTNTFVYDAAMEGLKRLDKLYKILEKWENKELNERNLTQKIYSIVNEIYTENINLPRGKNVILSDQDIKDLMIKNIIDGQCSEMSSNLLNLPGKIKKSPSADTLMMYLGRNSEKDIRKDIKKIFDTVNNKARKLKIYDQPLPLAIDFHLEPYYGKYRNKTIKTDSRKSHAGTAYNFKYATADIALDGARLTVYGQHISQLDHKEDIFKEVVEYSRDHINIDYLMADREFFTVKIIKYLMNEKIPYIIPAIKNKAIIKEAKKKFNDGINVFTYHFGQKDGIDITIFINRNEEFDQSKPSSSDNPEFYVFSTNMLINQADTTAENIRYCDPKNYQGYNRDELADMYSSRWGIETDYRMYVHEFRPRTTSNKFPIRYLNFFSGEIMRNIWVLSKTMLRNVYEKVLPGKKLRARLFKELLREGIEEKNIASAIHGLKNNLFETIKLLSPSARLRSNVISN